MRPVHRVVALAAVLHLAAVCLFVWRGTPEGPGEWRSIARTYQNVSGTFRDYTFFAPAVASDLRAGFFVEGEEEGRSTFVSVAARNREIGFRYNCIVASCMRDLAGRDLFARSWAALVLGSHPEARSTTVVVEAYDVPTMESYRQGQRPQWDLVYAGTFARRRAAP